MWQNVVKEMGLPFAMAFEMGLPKVTCQGQIFTFFTDVKILTSFVIAETLFNNKEPRKITS